jgi:two-component system, cell cycle response regulator DivK
MNIGSKNKVLVVEDNLLNLELVTDLLETAGYIVWPARTAEEGLHLARVALPDIILMDLSLPGMDGMAATRLLRANPETAHLPIIAITAHAMKGDSENALKAGFDGYLAKPINTRTFLSQVLDFIEAANFPHRPHSKT